MEGDRIEVEEIGARLENTGYHGGEGRLIVADEKQ